MRLNLKKSSNGTFSVHVSVADFSFFYTKIFLFKTAFNILLFLLFFKQKLPKAMKCTWFLCTFSINFLIKDFFRYFSDRAPTLRVNLLYIQACSEYLTTCSFRFSSMCLLLHFEVACHKRVYLLLYFLCALFLLFSLRAMQVPSFLCLVNVVY